MAEAKKLFPFIMRHEGGYVDDAIDAGGETNKGVTLSTWKKYGIDKNGDMKIDSQDLRTITEQDIFNIIFKPKYWDKWKADNIINQKTANLLVDWLWLSGPATIKIVQKIIKTADDGKPGKDTLDKLNNYGSEELNKILFLTRNQFITDIVEKSIKRYEKKINRLSTRAEQLRFTNRKYETGWRNRLNELNQLL